MKRSGKNFALALLLLFACLLAAPPEAAAQRIAVFPFDIYSERDATLLRNAIYNSMTLEMGKIRTIQIVPREQFAPLVSGKTSDEALALSVGKQIRADYVIVGSLTQLGTRVSLDAKAVTVETGAVITGLFAQGAGIENTGAFAAQLARDILARVSGTQVISRIDLTGNRRIESTVIYNVLKGAKGKLYSEEDLSSDIRAIYRTGYFTDVKADVTDSADGKVITFILEERPFVNEIRIKGNDAVKADDIRGVLSFKVKQAYNPDRIKADADKIKALYDDKGYYNAEISFATEKVKERDVNVIIDIKENDLLYVKTIEFTGNQAFTNKELKGLLETSEWSIFSFITDSGVLKKEKLRESLNRVKVFYMNNGYIQAQVGEPEITNDKKWIYIRIPVSEGRQFKVGKVEITGDTLSVPREELLDKLNIKKKDYYDREAISKDLEALTRVSHNDGYAYAEINPKTQTREAEQKVDITYDIKKGNLVYFNRINITGNTKTRDKVIRRQLTFTEGDLYNSDRLKNSYAALNRLRFFEEVNFQTAKGPDENLTDINIGVKERPTGLFSIGAGYSGQDGAMLMAQISQQNLFGRGQILTLQGALGTVNNTLNLSFTEPYLFDLPLWMKTDMWTLYTGIRHVQSRHAGGGHHLRLPHLGEDRRLYRVPVFGERREGHLDPCRPGYQGPGGRDVHERHHIIPVAGHDGRYDVPDDGQPPPGRCQPGRDHFRRRQRLREIQLRRVVVLQGPALRRRPRLLAPVAHRLHPGLRGEGNPRLRALHPRGDQLHPGPEGRGAARPRDGRHRRRRQDAAL